MNVTQPPKAELTRITNRVYELLSKRHETLAVAESLTGGLLASAIVEVPGISAVFLGGFIVYDTRLKASLVGVDSQLLADRGPVDAEVATQLALGACNQCKADWGLATTGIAGPQTQHGKPVGEVHVAAAYRGHSTVQSHQLVGSRRQIRDATVMLALELLVAEVSFS